MRSMTWVLALPLTAVSACARTHTPGTIDLRTVSVPACRAAEVYTCAWKVERLSSPTPRGVQFADQATFTPDGFMVYKDVRFYAANLRAGERLVLTTLDRQFTPIAIVERYAATQFDDGPGQLIRFITGNADSSYVFGLTDGSGLGELRRVQK